MNRRGKEKLNGKLILLVMVVALLGSVVKAEILYVNGTTGNDANPGTEDKPVRTIGRAAAMVNDGKKPGPTKIVISPGLYCLEGPVVIDTERLYSETSRLTIEASILPDQSEWEPALMPTIISVEVPRTMFNASTLTETYSMKIKISHVTIQGLRFLGNPLLNNLHDCVERIGADLDDLIVKQCVFAGDRDGSDIYVAALATGDRFIVEHCIFKGCGACAIFWDGPEETGGRHCAMRYCIVDGAYMSGPWTCQTTEDFEFHHNIVANSEYFWIRKQGDRHQYKINKCFLIGNRHFSGYGVVTGPTGRTGDEVRYEQVDVVTKGTLSFEKNYKSLNYMHVKEGSTGGDLGAGLFTRAFEKTK